MVGPLVPVVPLALYAGFAPLATLVCIVFLETPRPLRRTGAYTAGYVVTLVVLAAGGAIMGQWAGPGLAARLVPLVRDWGGLASGRPALSIAVGVALLALAAVRWRRRRVRPPAP